MTTQTQQRLSTFDSDFSEKFKQLQAEVELLSSQDSTSSFAKSAWDLLQELQKKLSHSSTFLPAYDLRRYQKQLRDWEEKLRAKSAKPIAKFSFSLKSKLDEITSNQNHIEKNGFSHVAGEENGKDFVDSILSPKIPSDMYSIVDRTGEKIVISTSCCPILLQNLRDCRVEIQSSASNLQLLGVENCVILAAPVTTSVWGENCGNSTIFAACQQLRLHKSENSRLYLFTTSKPIIEDSKGIMVAPYSLNISEDLWEKSGLNRNSANFFSDVQDFNYLSQTAHSPNWRILAEKERQSYQFAL